MKVSSAPLICVRRPPRAISSSRPSTVLGSARLTRLKVSTARSSCSTGSLLAIGNDTDTALRRRWLDAPLVFMA
ncbi:MAG TPA: hypothetical protein VIY28_13595 [Pseudonocardiaceae bacterium]